MHLRCMKVVDSKQHTAKYGEFVILKLDSEKMFDSKDPDDL